jgi:hypothetical protein
VITRSVYVLILASSVAIIVLGCCDLAKSTAAREIAQDDAVPPEAGYIDGLAYRLSEYRRVFGEFPPHDRIAEALLGERARNAGLNVRWTRLNSSGELLDSYGNPYRITYIGRNGVEIRSAGPNGIFGDADDFLARTFFEDRTPTQPPRSTATPTRTGDQ